MDNERTNLITRIKEGGTIEFDGPVKIIIKKCKRGQTIMLIQMDKSTKIRREKENGKS